MRGSLSAEGNSKIKEFRYKNLKIWRFSKIHIIHKFHNFKIMKVSKISRIVNTTWFDRSTILQCLTSLFLRKGRQNWLRRENCRAITSLITTWKLRDKLSKFNCQAHKGSSLSLFYWVKREVKFDLHKQSASCWEAILSRTERLPRVLAIFVRVPRNNRLELQMRSCTATREPRSWHFLCKGRRMGMHVHYCTLITLRKLEWRHWPERMCVQARV